MHVSLEIQDAKICHLRTITQLSQAISSQLRHVSTIGKKLVKQQYLPHMFLQHGELRPTNGWDLLASLGHPSKFQRVLRLGSVTAWHSSSGRQPNCGVQQRALPIFGRAAITFGIGPHSSKLLIVITLLKVIKFVCSDIETDNLRNCTCTMMVTTWIKWMQKMRTTSFTILLQMWKHKLD